MFTLLIASRAVLAERVDGELLARPLSRDHTPFRCVCYGIVMFDGIFICDEACQCCGRRPICRLLISVVICREDECERVKRFGARILTLDQLEGLKVGEHSHGLCLGATRCSSCTN